MKLRLACALLLVLAPSAGAEPGEPLSGRIWLEDALLVGEGETLRLAPGAVVAGPGRIVAYGTVEATGNASAPVQVSVPVELRGNGTSLFVWTRLWGVRGVALDVHAGNVSLANVTFEANAVGLQADGDGVVRARDVSFRAHATTGVRLSVAEARLWNATFHDNLLGLQAWLPGGAALHVQDAVFEENVQHALVDYGAPTARAVASFAGLSAGLARGEVGVALRSEGGEPGRSEAIFRASRFATHAVALDVAGRGFHVLVTDGTRFEDNDVALRVAGGEVHLTNATFARNARKLVADAGSVVQAPVASLLDEPATAALGGPAIPPAPRVGAWVVPVALAGLAAAVLLAPRAGRRARDGRVSLPEAPPSVPPPAAPPAPAGASAERLTGMERRVIEDVLAHPGSSQRAVAERLGITRQALHYHVKKLAARGLLVKVAEGRETRCYVREAAAARLADALEPDATAGARAPRSP